MLYSFTIRFLHKKSSVLGMIILLFIILFSLVGPILSPYSMTEINPYLISCPPNFSHLLGTDEVGRDILTRLMYGGRYTLLIGFISIAISLFIGTLMGLLSGYFQGIVDVIILRLIEILQCLPYLPTLIVFSAVLSDFGISPYNRIYYVIFIIGLLEWAELARIVRGEVLRLRKLEFMITTDALGLSLYRKLFIHLFPNVLPIIIITATLNIGSAILSESTLSFLGLGVLPPIPSWGQMIQSVRDFSTLQMRPWIWIPPSLMIFLTVLSINLIGEALRSAVSLE